MRPLGALPPHGGLMPFQRLLLLLLLQLLLLQRGLDGLFACCLGLRPPGLKGGPRGQVLGFVSQRPWGSSGGPPAAARERGLGGLPGAPFRGRGLFAADSRMPSGAYDRLRRLVNFKQQEVRKLQQEHASLSDPLQLRQHYVAHRHNGKLIEKLRIRVNPEPLRRSIQRLHEASTDPAKQQQLVQQQQLLLQKIRSHQEQQQHPLEQQHPEKQQQQQQPNEAAQDLLKELQTEDPDEIRLAVVCDVKRCSKVTSGGPPHRLQYRSAADGVLPLAEAGADVLLVATDNEAWGGSQEDLLEARKAITGAYGFAERPALVMKDLVIHPIQIAQAAEAGADGVYVIHSVAGGALDELLFAACTAGIEALVEVHGAGEARQAMDSGATLLVANQADRLTGLLYPNSAVEVRDAVSPEIIVAAKGGVNSRDEARQLARCGIDAVVLGRALLQEDCFDLLRDMRRIRAGPRSLVHLFAGMEAAAATLRKAREEEQQARLETPRSSCQEGLPGPQPQPADNEAFQQPPTPAAVAALCARPAEAGAGDAEETLGLAAAAADEVYSGTATVGRRGAPEPSCVSGPPAKEQIKKETDVAALDASLKTRVIRVSGTSEAVGDNAAGPSEGLRVFHSFDFEDEETSAPSKPTASSSSSSGSRVSDVDKQVEGVSDEALHQACAELLAAASEETEEAEPGGSLGSPVRGSSPEQSKISQNLLPRKVYTRSASGELEETVIDPLAAAVQDLDPKLVATLVQEAQADPKAFAFAAEQQILKTWRQAEELEAVEEAESLQPAPSPQAAAVSANASLKPKRSPVQELLLEPPSPPASPEMEAVPWAAAPVPGATREEVQRWLNDLNLQRAARFFLTPEETSDFFDRLKAAAERTWGPPVAPALASGKGQQGPEAASPAVSAARGSTKGHTSPQAQQTTECETAADNSTAAALQQQRELPSSGKGEAEAARGGGFKATVSPVSFGQWLMRPRGGARDQEEETSRGDDAPSPTAFSRVGCVDAKPPLASALDHMEPYIQYFQQQRQECSGGACQGSLSHAHERSLSSASWEGLASEPVSLEELHRSPFNLPANLDEEALRSLLPPPETAPQTPQEDEWDSGGIQGELTESEQQAA